MIKLDYLSGTLAECSTEQMAYNLVDEMAAIDERFERSTWEKLPRPVNFYTSRMVWNGTGLFLAWNETRQDMKMFFCMSGTDIELLGSPLLYKIIEFLKEKNFSCTRIDIAYDLFEDNGLIDKFTSEFLKYSAGSEEKSLVTQVKRENVKGASNGFFEGAYYENWTIGSRNGSTYYRFYDKRVEQKIRRKNIEKLYSAGSLTDDEYRDYLKRADYWYRIEIELKRGMSEGIFSLVAAGENLGAIMAEVMHRTLRVVESTTDIHNASRQKLAEWYNNFLESIKNESFAELRRVF